VLPALDEPRWLADEMLGRLARYLRFFGHDTVYVRGVSDAEIASRATTEGRTLLTRDRELARRTAGALLLSSPALAEQLQGVRRAFPQFGYLLTFERCTRCNGPLEPADDTSQVSSENAIPPDLRTRGLVPYVCAHCSHAYWEGSHTASIRRRIAEVFEVP
jgi:uncharacterized protein with PIN domain